MYCEVCKKNPATIHYTKVVNGLKEEKHLCEECAAKLKQNGEFADFWQLDNKTKFGLLPDFSMADFIGGFFNNIGPVSYTHLALKSEPIMIPPKTKLVVERFLPLEDK